MIGWHSCRPDARTGLSNRVRGVADGSTLFGIMITSILQMLCGVVLAWLGGSMFVDGAVALARWARWPVAVIGVTVAAFGTSAPELMVAIQAAVDGVPQISLGDVLGSNVVNVALVLALVLAHSGMKAEDPGVKRDWACALAVPFILAAVLWDGWFSRMDALVLIGLFVLWLALVVRHARRHRARNIEEVLDAAQVSRFKTGVLVVAGLGLLMVAAQFVVHGGKGVALALGWSPFIVGAVVVAVATGTPELATTIIGRIRGHHDVGLGNILGSNVFNILLIAALAALIHPYRVDFAELRPSLVCGVVTTLMILPGHGGVLGRWRGFVLLAMYVAYVMATLEKTG